ncbi:MULTISPECIES: RNA polymerase sigma factor [Chitinophagaceae]
MNNSQDLNNEATESLLEYIQWKDEPDYAEIAKEAFRVFTFRYQLELLKKLTPICKNWGYDKQVATELAYEAFNRIWKYPKFDLSKSKQKDYHKAITFYLFGIAKRLLADYKKSETEEPNPFTGDEDVIRDLPDIETDNKVRKAELQRMYDLLNEALSKLTPKHKVIYLTYKHYESLTNEGYNLPRHLTKKLQDELDLTQNSIRVYKKQAIEAVNTHLKIYGSK